MKRISWVILTLAVIAGALIGRWAGGSAAKVTEENRTRTRLPDRPSRPDFSERARSPKSAERDDSQPRTDSRALDAGALPGQRVIAFSDKAAMDRFLASLAGKGVVVLGKIDSLNAVRVGFLNPDALAGLLDGSEDEGFIFPARIPGGGSVQEGAIAFGDQFKSWLGIDGSQRGQGQGVKVAVLDTGVVVTDAFGNQVRNINLVDLPPTGTEQNGHGTAVASLIASELGLAPDADILSYRIADESGSSDTFLLAEAVTRAVDDGADLINISLGSQGSSVTLERAIQYATDAGVLVIASAGNEGAEFISFPAGFENTIGVGAVEAKGDHLDFSNSGDVSISAPGLGLTSAGTGQDPISFSGTSASAPVVTGAVALVMSQFNVTATRAYEMISNTANEAGAPGNDAQFGAGVLAVGRTLQQDTPGLTDVALASNHITTDNNGNTILQVTVENRGTSSIVNAPVTVTTPSGTSQLNVTTLPAGETQTFDIPVQIGTDDFRIDSVVFTPGGQNDLDPRNNNRTNIIPATDAP